MMNSINFPEGFVPGFCDNFVSNEVIVKDLTASEVWELLSRPSNWTKYYENCSDFKFHSVSKDANDELEQNDLFFFKTFGFPIEAKVIEYQKPMDNHPGRISWHGWDGEVGTDSRLDVVHAWLIEDLPNGTLRILTQETQNGEPAKALAATVPNPMINGHQAWLKGMVEYAQAAKGKC